MMEASGDPRRPDPIVNPIPRSDNPYIGGWKAGGGRSIRNVFQGAAKSLLNQ